MDNQNNSTKQKLILYVEDEDFQAKIFSKIIENEVSSEKIKVIVFSNGNEFIDLLNSLHKQYTLSDFSLILLDLSMHDISGLEMLKESKNRSIQTPIAILTAREDEEVKKRSIDIGAQEYFVKGKNIEELARLREFIIKSCN